MLYFIMIIKSISKSTHISYIWTYGVAFSADSKSQSSEKTVAVSKLDLLQFMPAKDFDFQSLNQHLFFT